MNRAGRLFCCLILSLLCCKPADAQQPVPRTLYAVYNIDGAVAPRLSIVHRALEMPLNWMGYHLEFIDFRKPLPPWRDDVAGVVSWLTVGSFINDIEAYINWLHAGLDKGKRLIIFGEFGFDAAYVDKARGLDRVNGLLRRIGVRFDNSWQQLTYDNDIIKKDVRLVEYERDYKGVLPSYYITRALKGATSHLTMRHTNFENKLVDTDLIITHPQGAYIAEGYGFYIEDSETDTDEDKTPSQRWIIDPFKLIELLFGDVRFPVPDVTTLNGRRIFYSHMDGDGWNNITELKDYNTRKTIAAEVLYQEIFSHYSTLPFTVAPIVSALRNDCYGRSNSAAIAKNIFALPNVEPSSHTYSHPLLWQYFDKYSASDEYTLLSTYPASPQRSKSVYDMLGNAFGTTKNEAWAPVVEAVRQQDIMHQPKPSKVDLKDFDTPRSYACEPFNLTKEIEGSIEYMQRLAPDDKKVRLLQWSGDTSPAESALAEVRKHGYFNINGGDSRFDAEYPSYSYVSPIGLKVGEERQIYSSNSNENTYTALWQDHFFGFRHLVNTVKNTDSPRRVSPFNIYYHSYSAEKQPSLEALKQNLDYASHQPIIPVYASDYAAIANGYYSANIIPLGEDRWQILDRGTLDTFRMDRATLQSIDWQRSSGVIGQHYLQGSLYIALDSSVEAPIIALKTNDTLDIIPDAPQPYLLESNWRVKDFYYADGILKIQTSGLGEGYFRLYWPKVSEYENAKTKLTLNVLKDKESLYKKTIFVNSESIASLKIDADASQGVLLILTQQ